MYAADYYGIASQDIRRIYAYVEWLISTQLRIDHTICLCRVGIGKTWQDTLIGKTACLGLGDEGLYRLVAAGADISKLEVGKPHPTGDTSCTVSSPTFITTPFLANVHIQRRVRRFELSAERLSKFVFGV